MYSRVIVLYTKKIHQIYVKKMFKFVDFFLLQKFQMIIRLRGGASKPICFWFETESDGFSGINV